MFPHLAVLAIAALLLPIVALLPSVKNRRHRAGPPDNVGIWEAFDDRRVLQATLGPSCDADKQRLALLTLFNNTNGASWINATGWPPATATLSPASLAQFAAMTPLTTSSCTASDGTVLPDHCCWHGVQCCTPFTCSNSASSAQSCASSAACSCTTGLVVGIALGVNNVSMRVLVQIASGLSLHTYYVLMRLTKIDSNHCPTCGPPPDTTSSLPCSPSSAEWTRSLSRLGHYFPFIRGSSLQHLLCPGV